MKGIELPISTLVILVIALIVLVGIIAFFLGVWTPGTGGIQLEAIKSSACQRLISTGCTTSDDIKNLNMDLDDDGSPGGDGDTLTLLCSIHYNRNSVAECMSMCGC